MNWFRKHFPIYILPIYINTLNIFRPLKTWWYNRNIASFPKLIFSFKRRPFDWLIENFYTWYWWDHPHIFNFKKKWIIIIIDDVRYKYKMGIRELESIPFILIRIFGYNLLIKFTAPKCESNYTYWEKLKQK